MIKHSAEEDWIFDCRKPHCFEIGCSSCFDMHLPISMLRNNRVDTKLIRTSMNTDFITMKMISNCCMLAEFTLKKFHIAHIIDAFLELANKTRCQAYQWDIAPTQFIGDQEMFMN